MRNKLTRRPYVVSRSRADCMNMKSRYILKLIFAQRSRISPAGEDIDHHVAS